jgi:hypothetical protein
MNDQKYWFAAKRYGWGWGLPIAWQGWVVLGAFIVLMIAGSFIFPPYQHKLLYLGYLAVLIALLIRVCYVKGEPLGWRWRRNDQD